MLARMAFDRSLRTIDRDGRMHIETSNISKAMVCPYMGREIPNAEGLGLLPDQVYMLLRDPAELEAAVATFNNLPLLSTHVPHAIADFDPALVVGSTGTDAVFEAPYLKNSLVIWEAVAIAGVHSHAQAELSCAYYYRADMTPGVYDGVQFDGVMRDLVGNHVALVETGRAGPDVVAADSLPFYGASEMKKSRTAIAALAALGAVIRPTLAQDAKMPELAPLFDDVTAKTLKPALVAGKVRAKLAQDSSLTAEQLAEVVRLACDGVSDEDEKPAEDEDDEEAKKKAAATANDEDPDKKPAMDAAAVQKLIAMAQDAARAEFQAIRTAENEVRPLLGEIVPQQSAAAVYKLALDAAGYDSTGVDPSAFRAVFRALPKPGAVTASPRPAMAADAANAESEFHKRFPTARAPGRG